MQKPTSAITVTAIAAQGIADFQSNEKPLYKIRWVMMNAGTLPSTKPKINPA